jgi:hypothetical protein
MDLHARHRRPRTRKRILGGAAIVAAIATLGITASAPASLFEGTFSGRITGVEGVGHFGYKGGNMKFYLCGCGRIKHFQFSKIRVFCTDGGYYRTTGRINPNVRAYTQRGARKFKFHATNSAGGVLKVTGFFRGDNHARGLLRYKGPMPTSGGMKTCTSFRQLWSAGYVH